MIQNYTKNKLSLSTWKLRAHDNRAPKALQFANHQIEARKFHKIAVANHLRIISVDRPGLGLSTFQKRRRILSWPAGVLSLTANLGIEKFSIFGHSAGSALTSVCAYAIPEKLNSVAIVAGLAPLYLPEARSTISWEQKFISKIVALFPFLASILIWTMYRKILILAILKYRLQYGMANWIL